MIDRNDLTRFASIKNIVSSNRLHVTWYEGWHPVIDEALQSLPEREVYSHELFRLLVQNPDSTRKRIAVVTDHESPVAVVGLRQLGRYDYESVTWLIFSDPMFPAKPGYWMPAIENLGIELFILWQGIEGPPPPSRLIRYKELISQYQIRCSENFEEYWRKSGNWKNVRIFRNRCRDFTMAVNPTGAAEWIINNWGTTWDQKPHVVNNAILVAKYFEEQERYYSLLLLDQDKPVAGQTFIQRGNDLVGTLSFRDRAYDWYGVGNRLMDMSFHWAQEAGFESIHLGGRHEYKLRWAPQAGEIWLLKYCPEPLFRTKQLINWARKIKVKVTNKENGDRK